MTTKEIADAWIDNHRPPEWKQLLAACRQSEALPDHVISWLVKFVPGFDGDMRGSPLYEGSSTEKAFSGFEEAFIAQVSAAVEYPG